MPTVQEKHQQPLKNVSTLIRGCLYLSNCKTPDYNTKTIYAQVNN